MILNSILSGPVLEPHSQLNSESLLWTWKHFSVILETGCAPSVSPLPDSMIATFLSYYCQAFRPELIDRNEKLQVMLQSKRFMRAPPLTSKFLVQPSNAECEGLETAYKDSRQMFQHSNRMFEEILQI